MLVPDVHSTFKSAGQTFEIRKWRDESGLHMGIFENGVDLRIYGSISTSNEWGANFYIGPAVEHLAAAVKEHVTAHLEGPSKM